MTKSKAISNMLITIFFGYFGVHKFMERKIGMGILYLCTLGFFGIGWFYDSVASVINCIRVCRSQNALKYSAYTPSQIDIPNQAVHDILNSPVLLARDFDCMEGHEFEHFCADLLRKNGFKSADVTKGSGDHGIDILAEKDGITYAIQCKCYSSNIGNAAVQQAHTGKSIYKKDIAVVFTNRYFTQQAIEEANALGVKLWDRDKLNKLIENTPEE